MKSAALPSILLIFDVSALMAGKTQDWKTFSQVGSCYVPEVIYQQIEFLANRADEAEQEKVAKEFTRFFSNSGWQLTCERASHPVIKPVAGAHLSKQARLVVALAQCVCGLAQKHPDKLVVFASNSQQLLQRMQSLNVENLCSINATAVLQWARTGQQPLEVTNHLHALQGAIASRAKAEASSKSGDFPRDSVGARTAVKRASSGSLKTAPPKTTSAAAYSRTAKSASLAKGGYAPKADSYKDKSAPAYVRKPLPTLTTVRSSKPGFFASLIYFALSAIAMAIAAGIMWRAIQPASFNQFWQRNIEPTLPKQLRGTLK